jgi:hypothetical protein
LVKVSATVAASGTVNAAGKLTFLVKLLMNKTFFKRVMKKLGNSSVSAKNFVKIPKMLLSKPPKDLKKKKNVLLLDRRTDNPPNYIVFKLPPTGSRN